VCLSQSDEQRLKDVEKQSKKGSRQQTNITKDFLKFNELIGLPKHPQTFKEHELTKIQLKLYNENIHPTKQVVWLDRTNVKNTGLSCLSQVCRWKDNHHTRNQGKDNKGNLW